MKSIAELIQKQNARSTAMLTAAVTDISTVQVTETVPALWMTEVVKYGEALRRLDQFAIVNKDLVGKSGDRVTIPINTGHLSLTVSHTEGEVRTLTELTKLDTVTIIVAAGDFYRGAIRIGKEISSLSAVDLVAMAKYSIAQDLADDVDLSLATAIQATAVTKNVFGGASTNADASDLATGDVLTTDLIVDAMALIEASDFVPKYLVIGPYQLAALRKDSQFVNAAEYGSNEVVMKGEIGQYLGIKIISTTNANLDYDSSNTDTNDASAWGANGFCCPMIATGRNGEPVAYAIVWKELPHIDYEFLKDECAHQIYYDQAFEDDVIQPDAICLIKVTDA